MLNPKYPLLVKYLNDDSFLRWLRGDACLSERLEWTNWLNENYVHPALVLKAYQLLELPFKQVEIPIIELEFQKLKRSIHRLKSNNKTGKPSEINTDI